MSPTVIVRAVSNMGATRRGRTRAKDGPPGDCECSGALDQAARKEARDKWVARTSDETGKAKLLRSPKWLAVRKSHRRH